MTTCFYAGMSFKQLISTRLPQGFNMRREHVPGENLHNVAHVEFIGCSVTSIEHGRPKYMLEEMAWFAALPHQASR